MTADYIPRSDAEFDTWQTNFMTYLSSNTAALGLDAADITTLTGLQTSWTANYASHVRYQALARSNREAKDESRGYFETNIRAMVRRLQASPDVSNVEREALGINVKDTTPTASSAMSGESASRPVGVVDTSERMRHTIRFFDETTPNKRAKPAGVMGCEIWVKVDGAAPASPAECRFLALDTSSPYVAEYTPPDAGKTAHYMLRWQTTRGDLGPWSETVSATIVS